jgi:hypothetical protein
LKKQGTHDVINVTNHALGLTILLGRVWAGHPMQNAMGEEERPGGRVVKLTAVITLDGFDGAAEPGRHIRRKVS